MDGSAFRLYRPENNFGKAYGLYTAASSPTSPSLGDSSPQLFWISFAQDFNATPLALASPHPVSLTFTPQNCGFHGLDFRVR